MKNKLLRQIPDRILTLAIGALAQANMHAVFADPGNEHWDFISVTNTAHAGELFLKAIIAKEHPLLIFKDLFSLDDNRADALDLLSLIKRGRTHDFEKLPQVLWVTTGQRLPNPDCFDRLRCARNSIQHFCAPEDEDFRALSLEFIYTIIDPLIRKNFGLYAIQYHEDHSVGYDYVVGCVVRHRLRFSVPSDFRVGEISLFEELEGADDEYRAWLAQELKKIGQEKLLAK
ncbi:MULTISPECIES: hypothetical protein [Bradyrhizobium]|uniref:hypothetical protein n=1 Tax=Bradyrhizobium elkanii TaxID=29448 RepID=UPI0027149A28|nr:hypothetical protein [Bradyrhizobium elkanii]WLA45086.1 hypothetical protein QIH80_24510 [Bradyrhizobium elkanii]WLB84770.1 hypothetical protein QIH83_20390 [Bradyrhizobium elkanii]